MQSLKELIETAHTHIINAQLREAFNLLNIHRKLMPAGMKKIVTNLHAQFTECETKSLQRIDVSSDVNEIRTYLIDILDKLEEELQSASNQPLETVQNKDRIIDSVLEQIENTDFIIIVLLGAKGAGKTCFLLALYLYLRQNGVVYQNPTHTGFNRMNKILKDWSKDKILPSANDEGVFHEIDLTYTNKQKKEYRFKIFDFSGEDIGRINAEGKPINKEDAYTDYSSPLYPAPEVLKPFLEADTKNILKFFVLDYIRISEQSFLLDEFMHYTRAYTKQHYDISVIVSKIDMKDKASDVQKQDYEANITNCVHKVLGTKGKHFEMTILKKTEDIKRNKAGMPIVKEQLHLVHIQEIYEWIIEKIEEKKLV